MKIAVIKGLRKDMNFPDFDFYEISDSEAEAMIEKDFLNRSQNASDGTSVEKRSIEEIMDEFNKEFYNEERKYRTHYADHFCENRFGEVVDVFDEFAIEDDTTNPELAAECSELIEVVKSLKPEYADVLMEVAIKGMSYSQYAAEKGISEATARQRLLRARKEMKKNLCEIK